MPSFSYKQIGIIRPFSRDVVTRGIEPPPAAAVSQNATAVVQKSDENVNDCAKRKIASRSTALEKVNEVVDNDGRPLPIAAKLAAVEQKSFESVLADVEEDVTLVDGKMSEITSSVAFKTSQNVVRKTSLDDVSNKPIIKTESGLREFKLKPVTASQSVTLTSPPVTSPTAAKSVVEEPKVPTFPLKKATARKSDTALASSNSMVFNFVNSNRVVTHIENDGLDMSKRKSKSCSVRP